MAIGQLGKLFVAKDNPPSLAYAIQTTVAAVASYLIARLFRLPEAYWAPISTLIGMQSTLVAALPVSAQYFAGTAIGAAVGERRDKAVQQIPVGNMHLDSIRAGCFYTFGSQRERVDHHRDLVRLHFLGLLAADWRHGA